MSSTERDSTRRPCGVPVHMDGSLNALASWAWTAATPQPGERAEGFHAATRSPGLLACTVPHPPSCPVLSPQQFAHLGAADLPDHQAVGAHTQGLPNQLHEGHLTPALDVCRAALETNHVGVGHGELADVLDQHDALVVGHLGKQGTEQRRLPAARATRDQQGDAALDQACSSSPVSAPNMPVACRSASLELAWRGTRRLRWAPRSTIGGSTACRRDAARKQPVHPRLALVEPPARLASQSHREPSRRLWTEAGLGHPLEATTPSTQIAPSPLTRTSVTLASARCGSRGPARAGQRPAPSGPGRRRRSQPERLGLHHLSEPTATTESGTSPRRIRSLMPVPMLIRRPQPLTSARTAARRR